MVVIGHWFSGGVVVVAVVVTAFVRVAFVIAAGVL